MKKLQIAAVALMAMSMSLVSCSDKENATPTAELSAETPALNIRYINVDTVLANYTLAKEFLAERQRVLIEYQTLENSKGNELQQEQNRIAQKYQSGGYLSEQSLQSDQQKLEQRANQTRNLLAQRQAKISQVMATQDSILNDSLRNFIRDLSRVNGITAVLDDKVTYYIDPALDITQAVIEGLNNRYKASAPAEEPAKK
ncbi:MAG: OmpH family outer membrane protein [Muribaculaceae bacterium]